MAANAVGKNNPLKEPIEKHQRNGDVVSQSDRLRPVKPLLDLRHPQIKAFYFFLVQGQHFQNMLVRKTVDPFLFRLSGHKPTQLGRMQQPPHVIQQVLSNGLV